MADEPIADEPSVEITLPLSDCGLETTDGGETWHVEWAPSGTTAYTQEPEAVPVLGEMNILHRDSAIVVVRCRQQALFHLGFDAPTRVCVHRSKSQPSCPLRIPRRSRSLCDPV